MKYRKKPLVIEAFQWYPNILEGNFAPSNVAPHEGMVYADGNSSTGYAIDTLERRVEVTPGDYIITGVMGEKYPCKPEVFEKSYDKVDE